MAKSRESFNKKNKEALKQKQRKEKLEKKEERKLHAQKGQRLEDMLAYVDEDGNITDTPPDPSRRREVNIEDIQISVPPGGGRDKTRHGVVQFFNPEKGFGFIVDEINGERIFFHHSNTLEAVDENDAVQFETQMGERGLAAILVKKAEAAS